MSDFLAALALPWVANVLLLSVRLAALLLVTPLLQALPVPGTVRVLLVLALAAAIALPLPPVALAGGLGALFAALLQEAAVGATLGLGVSMAFAGFALAGRLLDVQVGFGIGQVFDPQTRSQVPVLSAAFGLAGVLLFFLVNGHHALMRGVAYSLERVPPGRPWAPGADAAAVLQQAAGLFTLGFALAAPVVLFLLLVEFALGVIARNLPQVNIFVLGLPVKVLAGLLALALWAGGMGEAAHRIYREIYRGWSAVFEAAPAVRGTR